MFFYYESEHTSINILPQVGATSDGGNLNIDSFIYSDKTSKTFLKVVTKVLIDYSAPVGVSSFFVLFF